MLLVPPWKYVQTMSSGYRIPPRERNAGYALVFSPPSVKDHDAIREAFSIPLARPDGKPIEIFESYYEVRLDSTRLLAQCAAATLVTLGLVVFLHRGRLLTEDKALNIEEGTSRLVAWMPGIGQKSTSKAAQLVGAVLIPVGQELPNTAMYLSYLADRVQEMIEREEDPEEALGEMIQQLASVEMMGEMPERLSEAGHCLVIKNPALRARLSEMGVPGFQLPKRIYGGSHEAKRLVETTSLWTWTNYVLNRPNGRR